MHVYILNHPVYRQSEWCAAHRVHIVELAPRAMSSCYAVHALKVVHAQGFDLMGIGRHEVRLVVEMSVVPHVLPSL